jgi:hypothetical protein
MPFTEINGRQQWIPADHPLAQKRPQSRIDPNAFSQERADAFAVGGRRSRGLRGYPQAPLPPGPHPYDINGQPIQMPGVGLQQQGPQPGMLQQSAAPQPGMLQQSVAPRQFGELSPAPMPQHPVNMQPPLQGFQPGTLERSLEQSRLNMQQRLGLQYAAHPVISQQQQQDNFDNRWMDRNAQGRAQQAGGASFGMGPSGDTLGGAYRRDYSQEPPGQLTDRSAMALNPGLRNPMYPINGIPLEQRGFAKHQGIGQYGQQLPSFVPQEARDGGQPQDQYGLRRALGTGNIDRSVASAPAGVLGQNIPQPDFQVLGVLPGGAEVSQDMGRHIVRGNAPPNSQNAKLQAYTKENYEARKLADNQKRYESALRKPGQKLSDSYLRNKFNIPADAGTPGTPGLPKSNPIDVAAPNVANSDPKPWKNLGVKADNLASTSGAELADALTHKDMVNDEKNGGLSAPAKAKLRQEAQDWVTTKKRDNSVDPHIAEVEALIAGDVKKSKELRAKRLKDAYQESINNPPYVHPASSMPGGGFH